MDPKRKRTIRLVVALGAAVLLAGALVYTSFSGSAEARNPSELLNAQPGQSYKVTGKVVPDTITRQNTADGQRISFRVRDRDGTASIPVVYEGVVPDPFRENREVIVSGEMKNGTFVGERDSLVTKCPSKFKNKQDGETL
jgi:cytochrome c-type biogenesis protein CcmE